LQKVGGLFPNTLYNVSGFSLPSIKTDRHHITEKLLSMAKILNNQSAVKLHFKCIFCFVIDKEKEEDSPWQMISQRTGAEHSAPVPDI
jgi:hypothetical protein